MLKKGTIVYTAFSEYVIEKQISQGGNGTVFLVHNQNGEKYALKAIDRDKCTVTLIRNNELHNKHIIT